MRISIVNGALGTTTKGFSKGTGRLRNQRTSDDRSDYSIVKIVQNTEKSPSDLRRLTERPSASAGEKNSIIIMMIMLYKE